MSIITFYSYKGGTGRSMGLANLAWILACCGRRVLVIDWDLEAPGIEKYFADYVPSTRDRRQTPGRYPMGLTALKINGPPLSAGSVRAVMPSSRAHDVEVQQPTLQLHRQLRGR